MKKSFFTVLVILFVISRATAAPSHDKGKFDDLQKFINDSENAIKLLYDYEVKMKLCENVISSIDEFIENSNDKKLITSIQKNRSIWKNRYDEYYELLIDLSYSLENEMQKRAIEIANARHKHSKFESIELIDSDISKYDDSIYLTETYKVITRGTILGIIGNVDNIAVQGKIDMRNNKIQVIEAKVK